MSPLLKKNGKLIRKGGKLVKVTDPANCDCCEPPPCPPLPPFCTVKINPGNVTGLADPQTNQAVAGMLALTIDSIPLTGLGYSKVYTPPGATSPITVVVVIGAGATAPSVSVSGSSLNWPVPGGVPSQPNGQFPPLLMSFGYRGNGSNPVMDVAGVCSGAEFEFDAEDPDRATGLVEDGRGSPWPFESNLNTLTVTFQKSRRNPLP